MDDRALTSLLAAAAHVQASPDELDAVFAVRPALTEWSLNPAADRRGALRVSLWTKDRPAAVGVVERFAPALLPIRDALVGEELEGVGLALRGAGPSSFRWWTFADDGAALAARARRAWPADVATTDAVLGAAGGAHTCAAVGVEVTATGERHTIYAELRTPASAIQVLELAAVPVSQPANLFWKGIVGLEPGGRPWPRVWVGRSVGPAGGWKFYYFARGDELRRTDEVLLDAVSAGPDTREVWAHLRGAVGGPCVQFVGITFPDDRGAPSFTTYLARI
jgi:hypothetical protein